MRYFTYGVERAVSRAFAELQDILLRAVVYVDLGARAILDIFVENLDELLVMVFAVLAPDRFPELRYVHQELK